MRLHPCREEAQSAKRVGGHFLIGHGLVLIALRAKYIEGLENRLGRMESLLKLSGLLGKDEEGRTDLGTLEQRFAQQASSNHGTPTKTSPRSSSASHQDNAYQIPSPAPPLAAAAIPKSTTKSPETTCEEEKRIVHELNVEALSDMMCSLVTNNCGETRYIGESHHK